jgi:hypothetical protein
VTHLIGCQMQHRVYLSIAVSRCVIFLLAGWRRIGLKLLLLSTHFDTVVEVEQDTVRMIEPPENLIFEG